MKNNKYETCWEYYNCSLEAKQNCLAYKKGYFDKNFDSCILYVKNLIEGGPGKHGPCAKCEWNLKYGPCSKCNEISKITF